MAESGDPAPEPDHPTHLPSVKFCPTRCLDSPFCRPKRNSPLRFEQPSLESVCIHASSLVHEGCTARANRDREVQAKQLNAP